MAVRACEAVRASPIAGAIEPTAIVKPAMIIETTAIKLKLSIYKLSISISSPRILASVHIIGFVSFPNVALGGRSDVDHG